MTALKPMTCTDLFDFNRVNFDQLTETFSIDFYYEYLETWPQYQTMARDSNGFAQGYFVGKVEGTGPSWHAHVSAVTVEPDSRRLGLGGQLMDNVEKQATEVDNAYFVDLFVRKSNQVAVGMYEKLGYIVYRTITDYYHGPPLSEDGLDMRKALPRDKELAVSSLKVTKAVLTPDELEFI